MLLFDTDSDAISVYEASFESIPGSARVARAVEMAEEAKTESSPDQ